MKWILPSLALAIAPLASSCASVPVYGDWVVADYCGNTRDEGRAWARTGPPANADLYRRIAAAEVETDTDVAPAPDSREYWFALPTGEVKYCLTPLHRNYGDCDVRVATWWVFRQTETGPVTDGGHYRVCVL